MSAQQLQVQAHYLPVVTSGQGGNSRALGTAYTSNPARRACGVGPISISPTGMTVDCYFELLAGFLSNPAGALCDELPVPVVSRTGRRACFRRLLLIEAVPVI